MTISKMKFAAAGLCLALASAAQAGSYSGGVTDQSYNAGKYARGSASAAWLNSCPREFREIYRGNLYCRSPQYPVALARQALCPREVWGLYRGNLYCFGPR